MSKKPSATGSEAIDFRPGLFVGAGDDRRPAEPPKPQPLFPAPPPVIKVEFSNFETGEKIDSKKTCGTRTYDIPSNDKMDTYMKDFVRIMQMSEQEATPVFYYKDNQLTGKETPRSLGMSNAPPGELAFRRNWVKLFSQNPL